MPEIEFVLVGPNYSNTDLGALPSWIHVLPPPKSIMEERDLFASCDVFVMPSKFEGFSQAVLKAMAQERKIIATDVGGLPFELGYGTYGRLVQYGDVDALGATIVESLDEDSPHSEDKIKNYVSGFVFEKRALGLESQYINLCRNPSLDLKSGQA
jgi:glycosyltransferase involved in cell wall biosynthesis